MDVLCVFDQCGSDMCIVIFADEKDIARWARPLQSDEIMTAGLYILSALFL